MMGHHAVHSRSSGRVALLAALVLVLAAVVPAAVTPLGVQPAAAAGEPVVSVGGVDVREGDSGTAKAYFDVTLSKPATSTVKVRFTADDGTAVSAGKGKDFGRKASTVKFSTGQQSRTVPIAIKGDTYSETDESFVVQLTNPVGLALGNAVAVGRIIDDDPDSGLRLSVSDVAVYEPTAGNVNATFTVSLSSRPDDSVSVDYQTEDGSATSAGPGNDYTAVAGTLLFPPRRRYQTVSVPVTPSGGTEGPESFGLRISAASGATITDDLGIGTIGETSAHTTAPGPALPSAPLDLSFYTPPSPLPETLPGEVIWSRVYSATGTETTYLVLYRSVTMSGETGVVSGFVAVPTAAAPPEGRPVVVWAPWTVGLHDTCAPTRSGDRSPYFASLISAGYTVAVTDFEGLGTPGPHPYVMAASEARSVLDAARAARDMDPSAGSDVVVIGGSPRWTRCGRHERARALLRAGPQRRGSGRRGPRSHRRR